MTYGAFMQLIVLGSGTAMPLPDRSPPGYLIQSDSTLLLLDCGSGTLQRLARVGCHPKMLTGVFISHAHLDHVADLSPLLFSLRLPGCELTEPLPLHAGPGFSHYLNGLQSTFGDWVKPKGAALELHEHASDDFRVGDLRLRTAAVEHHNTSIGVRIEAPNGASLAYLGDTDLCDAAIDLCAGVDLAIIECSMPDELDLPGHLCPRKIAQIVAAARPNAILLTHFYPPALEIDPIEALRAHGCDVPAKLAHDGLGVSIDGRDD